MTFNSFADIISFTRKVKVVKKMKIEKQAIECVEEKFLKIPNIEKYEVVTKVEYGFIAVVEMNDGYEFQMHAYVFQQVFPSTVMNLIEKQKNREEISILVAPYISERTAHICEQNGLGYFDYAGNCWFAGHSVYLSERGNKNPRPKDYKAVTIFDRSSVVSSLILRELFSDITKSWKLKYLSEKVNCSIGQVSKVMNYLIENVWAEKTNQGYQLRDPEALLKEWSNVYGKKEFQTYTCYSLDNVSVIEKKLSELKQTRGIDSYLTGFSGGVRYTPVVRYNKVQVYISPEDIRETIESLEMKEVTSGANVVIFSLENDCYIKDSKIVDESMVVSPVQIYLDCMQLKGRGEEMAEAILRKEIMK